MKQNKDILKNIKYVLFDMDGVLRIGNKPIKGSSDIFIKLENSNIKSMIVTNECRYTNEQILEDFEKMNIKISNETKIITSGYILYMYIREKVINNPENKYILGVIGETGLNKFMFKLSELENLEIMENPPNKETIKKKGYKLILVIGSVNNIIIDYLQKILSWIQKKAIILTTCKDMSDPSSKGTFNVGMPNHMLHMSHFNIKSNSYSLGKPNPIVSRYILDIIESEIPDIKREEILFVGDSIYTDIQLAEESGFKSLLVLTGNTKRPMLNNLTIEPNYILESINDLI